MDMIQEKKEKKECQREGISAEAMPLRKGEWMSWRTRTRGQVHLYMKQRRQETTQWTANVGRRTFLTGRSSDKEIKAPRHEEIS